jgi:hypothetical protein
MKLSESPVDVHRSLLLGEHNEDIYGRELGRDDQLASLKAKRGFLPFGLVRSPSGADQRR